MGVEVLALSLPSPASQCNFSDLDLCLSFPHLRCKIFVIDFVFFEVFCFFSQKDCTRMVSILVKIEVVDIAFLPFSRFRDLVLYVDLVIGNLRNFLV